VLFGSLTRSTSAPFRVGYLHNVVALSGRLWIPLAFRLPAFASWTVLSSWRIVPSLRRGLLAFEARPHEGFHVSHCQDAIGVGVLCTPGPWWCPHEDAQAPSCINSGRGVHCPVAQFAVLGSQPLRRFAFTKPQQGFTHVHPSDLSPVQQRRLARRPLGLSPMLPDLAVASNARRSREQAWTLAWIVDGTHLLSLVQCDLVSRLRLCSVQRAAAGRPTDDPLDPIRNHQA
jgi:hypothetical protein